MWVSSHLTGPCPASGQTARGGIFPLVVAPCPTQSPWLGVSPGRSDDAGALTSGVLIQRRWVGPSNLCVGPALQVILVQMVRGHTVRP